MGRYTGAKVRLSRREGVDLMLKGSKTFTDKNPLKKRNSAPGQHGFSRSRLSDYGIQLREKQKVKRMYGLFEKQFRNVYKKASKSKGLTGEVLLSLLERRIDNVLYRAGVCSTRAQARKTVGAKKVLINGVQIKTPSQIVYTGDKITFSKEYALAVSEDYIQPVWVKYNEAKQTVEVVGLPTRSDIVDPLNEQLVVEYYSR